MNRYDAVSVTVVYGVEKCCNGVADSDGKRWKAMEWSIPATAPAPQTLHRAGRVSSALLPNIPLYNSYGNLPPLRGETACVVG